ncbi:MAG: thiamine-phosphate kinase, partial [Verrucomicrobiota bacterium]
MDETLGTIGEDGLIDLLTGNLGSNPQLLVGPGDDCAVIDFGDSKDRGLLKTDCVIEGVHFLPDADPEKVGWKAAARVVSDFAAMGGGQPEQALVTLIAPSERNVDWARGIYVGLDRCAQKFGFAIAGGETSTSEIAVISVSMFGRIAPDQIRLRSDAKLGDTIYVSGELGGAVESGKHLDFEPRLELARELNPVHAMMD